MLSNDNITVSIKNNPRTKTIKYFLLIILSAVLGFSIGYFYLGRTIKPLLPNYNPWTPSPADAQQGDIIDVSKWKTYSSKEMGISIKYPESWKLLDAGEPDIIALESPEAENCPYNDINIAISKLNNENKNAYDQYQEQINLHNIPEKNKYITIGNNQYLAIYTKEINSNKPAQFPQITQESYQLPTSIHEYVKEGYIISIEDKYLAIIFFETQTKYDNNGSIISHCVPSVSDQAVGEKIISLITFL